MTKRRWLLAFGVALAALAAGLSVALVGGASKKLTHADFVRLWNETRIGEPTATVLARWPKNPYQHFTDSSKYDCYEFTDVPDPAHGNMPQNLYNLCFKDGVLRTKAIG